MFIIFRSLPLLHLAKLILPKELLWRKVSSFLMKAGIYRRAMHTLYFLLLPSCYSDDQPIAAFISSHGFLKVSLVLQHWILPSVANVNRQQWMSSCYFKILFWSKWNVTILFILMYFEGNNNVLGFENNREKSSINLQLLSC